MAPLPSLQAQNPRSSLLSLLVARPHPNPALPLPSLSHVTRLDISDTLAPWNIHFPSGGNNTVLPYVSQSGITDSSQTQQDQRQHRHHQLPATLVRTPSAQHQLSAQPRTHDLGPLALLELFQATFLRILELGFWRGVLGSLAVLLVLVCMATGMCVGVAMYLGRREENQDFDDGGCGYGNGYKSSMTGSDGSNGRRKSLGAGRARPSQRRVRMVLEGRRDGSLGINVGEGMGMRGALWREGRRINSGKRVRWVDEVFVEMETGIGIEKGGIDGDAQISTERKLDMVCVVCAPGPAVGVVMGTQDGGCDLLTKLD